MNDLNTILDTLDLADWLDDQAIDYRRVGSGDNLAIRECVFCGDNRSRVYFSQRKKRGICFVADCPKSSGFNLWSFARAHLGTDNAGTARHFEEYAARQGLFRSAPAAAPAPVSPEGWELPESIPLGLLPDGHTHTFLLNRGITLDTQSRFGLRWCEHGTWSYRRDGDLREMDFSGRIIIPVHDLDGTLATFQGRDATGESMKRYLFPATLPGTGRYLYGGNLVSGKSHLVIGEGPFDVMAIHQALADHPDFRDVGAIGSFGLFIGRSEDENDQLHRLMKLREQGANTLTFLWDGEPGATHHAIDEGEKLTRMGFQVRLGLLPAGCDPNEVETSRVRKAIEEAQPLTAANVMHWRLCPPYRA